MYYDVVDAQQIEADHCLKYNGVVIIVDKVETIDEVVIIYGHEIFLPHNVFTMSCHARHQIETMWQGNASDDNTIH